MPNRSPREVISTATSRVENMFDIFIREFYEINDGKCLSIDYPSLMLAFKAWQNNEISYNWNGKIVNLPAHEPIFVKSMDI